MDHILAELPPTWSWSSAREVCTKIQDGTHFSPKIQLSEGTYRYITAKNIRPWGLDLSTVTYLREEDHRAIYARCDAKKGDVLLVKDGVNTGDAATNTLDEEISLLSSVCLLRPQSEALSSSFLRYFLLSPVGYGFLTGQMTGTAIKRIVLHRIKDLPVPIAPLPEQHRIVAAIETQFTRLDASVAALERARGNLKRYRAAVLKAACEGRLVPTEAELARAEGRGYEPASVLLERILLERRDQWELFADGQSQRKPTDKARYPVPEGANRQGLPEPPTGWHVSSLEQLTSATRTIRYGILMPKENVENGVLYVKVKDFKGDRIDVGGLYRTDPDIAAQYAKASLAAGDLLLAIRGTYGRVAEVPPELQGGNITQDTARLAISDLLDRRYIAVHLRSPISQDYFKRVARGVAVKGVNIADVRLTPIMLPPLAEQHRIVAEVERRLSVVEEMEAAIGANLKRAERLRQAILRRAFAGKLVAQDPTDEPASVLLERIRAERTASGGVARSGRGKRRSRSVEQLSLS